MFAEIYTLHTNVDSFSLGPTILSLVRARLLHWNCAHLAKSMAKIIVVLKGTHPNHLLGDR